ncbi:MAG: hypothetical protein ABIJ96_12285 [Elusimicrobiota bacterium]
MILLTAATPWEVGPIAHSLGLRRNPEAGFIHNGRVMHEDIVLLKTGMGAASTMASLKNAAPWLSNPLTAAISTGFAGALQAGLASGDIVADLHGAPESYTDCARSAADRLRSELHLGRIISSSQVVAEPARKRALGDEKRAAAVDMESDALRSWAQECGTTAVSVRVILDEIEHRIPTDIPVSAALPDILRYAASHFRDLPLLLRLALAQRRGGRILGAYLLEFINRLAGDRHEQKT